MQTAGNWWACLRHAPPYKACVYAHIHQQRRVGKSAALPTEIYATAGNWWACLRHAPPYKAGVYAHIHQRRRVGNTTSLAKLAAGRAFAGNP